MNKYTVWPKRIVLNFKLDGTYSNHWTLKGRASHLHKSCISWPVPNNRGAGHAEAGGRATVNKWTGKGVDAKSRDVFKGTIQDGLITYHGISITIREVMPKKKISRSQWPRGLRRRSTAARLLRSWVRIPPGTWMSAECFVFSGRGICDGLITRPEESYRLWFVWVWSWSLDSEDALTHFPIQH